MGKYDELVDYLRGKYGYDSRYMVRPMKQAADAIEELEAINEKQLLEIAVLSKEREKGKWIEEDIDFDTFWKCSECGFNGAIIPDNFCPRCGADMR